MAASTVSSLATTVPVEQCGSQEPDRAVEGPVPTPRPHRSSAIDVRRAAGCLSTPGNPRRTATPQGRDGAAGIDLSSPAASPFTHWIVTSPARDQLGRGTSGRRHGSVPGPGRSASASDAISRPIVTVARSPPDLRCRTVASCTSSSRLPPPDIPARRATARPSAGRPPRHRRACGPA